VFCEEGLRKIFGSKRDELIGGWKNMLNEKLHNLYSSPHIIRMIKTMRMRWAEHIARMEKKRNSSRILVGKPEGKIQRGRRRRSWEGNIKMEFRERGRGLVAGPCEHGTESSGSIEFGEFLVWMSNCWLLKKDSAPWSWLVDYSAFV
jgi:hypothetical protein